MKPFTVKAINLAKNFRFPSYPYNKNNPPYNISKGLNSLPITPSNNTIPPKPHKPPKKPIYQVNQYKYKPLPHKGR
jgi:hypothetical protein